MLKSNYVSTHRSSLVEIEGLVEVLDKKIDHCENDRDRKDLSELRLSVKIIQEILKRYRQMGKNLDTDTILIAKTDVLIEEGKY